jgi:hypothetical protein
MRLFSFGTEQWNFSLWDWAMKRFSLELNNGTFLFGTEQWNFFLSIHLPQLSFNFLGTLKNLGTFLGFSNI